MRLIKRKHTEEVELEPSADVEPDAPLQRRDWRAWNDRSVKALLVIAIALAAFAGGRFSVHQGPKSLAEAMQQARAGTLPQGDSAGGGGFPSGGFPGRSAGASAGARSSGATGAGAAGGFMPPPGFAPPGG